MDRGAWQAAVHVVRKSWTWLGTNTFTFRLGLDILLILRKWCGKKPWLILLSRKPGCLDSVPSSARAPSSGTWPITSLQQGFIQHRGKFRGPDWLPIREIHIHLGQSPRAIILSVAFQKVSQNSAEIFMLHRQLLSLPLYPLHFGKLLLLW